MDTYHIDDSEKVYSPPRLGNPFLHDLNERVAFST